MRDNDSILLEQMYGMILEFSDAAVKKMVAHFKKTSPEVSDNVIISYLKRFERIKDKLEKKDPFQYKTFKDFETIVDANDKSMVSTEHTETDKGDLKVYEDENIIVYKAKNQMDTTLLGDNQYYSFCISRKLGGNMYPSYRKGGASTFYFIRFKKKSDKKDARGLFEDPSHYIVLDVRKNGYEWTWADNGSQGHDTRKVDIETVLKTFPELQKPYDEKIFVNEPLSEKEIQKMDFFISLENDFDKERFDRMPYPLKREYIATGYDVESVTMLDRDLRNHYIGMGHRISDNDFKSLTASEKKRWAKVREREILELDDIDDLNFYAMFMANHNAEVSDNIINKISRNPYDFTGYVEYLVEYDKPVKGIVLDIIIRNPNYSFNYVKFLLKKNKPVDPKLLNSLSKNPEYAYKYAVMSIEMNKPVYPIFLKSIAKNAKLSYEYASFLYERNMVIPEYILQNGAKYALDEAIMFVINMMSEPVPKDLEYILSVNNKYAYEYAEFLTSRNDRIRTVPDVVKNALTPQQKKKLGIDEAVKESFQYRTFKQYCKRG